MVKLVFRSHSETGFLPLQHLHQRLLQNIQPFVNTIGRDAERRAKTNGALAAAENEGARLVGLLGHSVARVAAG